MVSATLPAEAPQPAPPRTPSQTVTEARRLYAEKRLEKLHELIAPRYRHDAIELLHAIDRVVLANQVLQKSIRQSAGEAAAKIFDRGEIANAVGPFSPSAAVVSEQIDGERALVTYQLGGRVPLREATLVLSDAAWLIQTDPPIPGLVDELRKLADVLTRVAERVEKERLDAPAIQHELDLRQKPIVERIAALSQTLDDR